MTTREWAQQWQRTGEALARIKHAELRAFDYERNLPALDALLQAALDTGIVRRSTGLVEQQRLFDMLRVRR